MTNRVLKIAPARRAVKAPLFVAAAPAALLGVYWAAGETALAASTAVFAAAAGIGVITRQPDASPAHDAQTGLPLRDTAVARLNGLVARPSRTNRKGAVIVLRIDDAAAEAAAMGAAAWNLVVLNTADHIVDALRDGDQLVRLEGPTFGVILNRSRRMDLDALVQIADRLRASAARPIRIGGASVRITASVGLCPEDRRPSGGGAAYLHAAELALDDAVAEGPANIRVYTDEIGRRHAAEVELDLELGAALDSGQFQPYLQPQVQAGTGRIIGFEALARWHHPARGVLSPYHFLDRIERQGLDLRLFEVMLTAVCGTLARWDRAGYRAPAIAINLSRAALLDPMLVEKVRWELDRHDLAPERLCIEVLETVVAFGSDDLVVRNVERLVSLGCSIDLDDFGTGQASFSAIRRFGIQRIKLDRSFVTHCDTDTGQRRMITAMLGMARTLEIGTIAEGVEQLGEQRLLYSLGCDAVQGYVIARPMPVDDALAWALEHDAKLAGSAGSADEGDAGARKQPA